MNRKNLTAAVLAGLAGAVGIVGSAQAVNINPDGLGQVLIYPYYTTNGGNMTILSVVNTTDSAKAVKVRFKEGKNSREVLDFNLYLSRWDVWSAVVYNVDGIPTLKTTDSSCTVPTITTQEFLPWAMNDTGVEDEYGPISRATEGYFEMIEMGTLVDESESAIAATHVDGTPPGCADLVDAWTVFEDGEEGYWVDFALTDIGDPVGGLFGGAAIVNVANGAMYSYDAKAIEDFATVRDPGQFPLHNPPGDSSPSLNSGDVLDGDIFYGGTAVNSGELDRGVDAISFVFMHDQVMNEYTTEIGVAAATEWVLTFPTKAYYVYGEEAGGLAGEILEDDDVLPPFTKAWDGMGACEVVTLDTIWDREERTILTPIIPGEEIPPIVSPRPPGTIDPVDPIIPLELCYETSVIRFGEEPDVLIEGWKTEVLGSSNWHNIDNTVLGFQHGWARLQLDDYAYDRNANGVLDTILTEEDLEQEPPYTVPEADLTRTALGNLEGLPVTGFAVERFANSTLGDGNVLANYGGIYQHKATRKMGSLIPQ
jgi:hypothetical protein